MRIILLIFYELQFLYACNSIGKQSIIGTLSIILRIDHNDR